MTKEDIQLICLLINAYPCDEDDLSCLKCQFLDEDSVCKLGKLKMKLLSMPIDK